MLFIEKFSEEHVRVLNILIGVLVCILSILALIYSTVTVLILLILIANILLLIGIARFGTVSKRDISIQGDECRQYNRYQYKNWYFLHVTSFLCFSGYARKRQAYIMLHKQCSFAFLDTQNHFYIIQFPAVESKHDDDGISIAWLYRR